MGCALGADRLLTPAEAPLREVREAWLPTNGHERVPVGGEAVLTTNAGQVWLGTRLRNHRGCVRLQLAGVGRVLAVRSDEVLAMRVCPPHSYQERQIVVRRQRQGLPAMQLRLTKKDRENG